MSYTLNNVNVTYTPGNIIFYAGITAPNGWRFCDGSAYLTSTYPELFNIIGYRYGGSGSIFNVPSMGDSFIYGASVSQPLSNVNIGYNYIGLSIDNIPHHTHTYKDACYAEFSSGGTGSVYGGANSNNNNRFVYRTTSNTVTFTSTDPTTQLNTGSSGSDSLFSIIPECIVFNYIIKT